MSITQSISKNIVFLEYLQFGTHKEELPWAGFEPATILRISAPQHTNVPRAKDALDMIATTPPQLFSIREQKIPAAYRD
jgi:hypothetical protein